MQAYTQINPHKSIYDPSGAMGRMQAVPTMYGSPALQGHFADLYRPTGQRAAMEFDRANTQQRQQYFGRAAEGQNQSALAGLGLLSEQEQNAMQRGQAAQKIAYGWMNDMFSGAGKLLGGLL